MLSRALVVAIGIMGASIAAHAASTYSNLPPATQPLGSVPDAVPMDQGTGCTTNTQPCATVQSPSSRFGQPIQANCQSLSAPTQYEQCINTAVSPPMLEIYLGTTWAPIAIFNASAGTYTPVNDNSVANTVALRASSFAQFPNGVWRLTDGVAGASKLFYAPDKAGVCSADDGGKCVLGSGGGYWLAQFGTGVANVRQWSPDPTGAANSSAAFNSCLAAMAPGGTCYAGGARYNIAGRFPSQRGPPLTADMLSRMLAPTPARRGTSIFTRQF